MKLEAQMKQNSQITENTCRFNYKSMMHKLDWTVIDCEKSRLCDRPESLAALNTQIFPHQLSCICITFL